MADFNCIDYDDDYANDLRRYEAGYKNEKEFDNERRFRRSLRNIVKIEYGSKREGNERVDDNYGLFLNYYSSELGDGGFDDTDCGEADDDLQYGKFLSLLKPCKTSYVLDFVKADGCIDSFAYEVDGVTSDKLKRDSKQNAVCDKERNGGMRDSVFETLPESGNGKDFKSADESSEACGRSATNDKIGTENVGQKKSGSKEFMSLKPVTTDSQMQSIDVSYQFYLVKNLEGKQAEKLSCFQGSKKRNIRCVTANATKKSLRNRQVKKTRLSQKSGEGMDTTVDANVSKGANGYQIFGKSGNMMQKLESKQGGERRHCRNLRNSCQKTVTNKVVQKDAGLQAANDKQRKKHRWGVEHKNNGRRSVAPILEQEAIAAVPLRQIPDGKLVKNHRLSRYSEQATKRILIKSEAKDATDSHAINAFQTSGKKSCPKIHNQPGSEVGFDQLINDSYNYFLGNLTLYEGKPVFRSKDGRLVTYEQDMKNSTDLDSDSDGVLIIGDNENGKMRTIKQSSYKKKLMSILLKPYDKKEYKMLMENAIERKPLEGYRDMRGGRKGTYGLEILGKSYLDHHKDVAKAIKDCGGNTWKILTILRGFMFWIQHVADHGSFRPWIYEQYMEVKPPKNLRI